MKILERLQLIERRAQVAQDDGSLRQDLAKVEKATDKVAALTKSLERLVVAYRELQPIRKDECAALVPVLNAVVAILSSLAEQASTTPQAGAKPEFVEGFAKAEKAVKNVEQSLTNAWVSYRQQHQKPTVDRDLLAILQRAGLDVDHLLERYDAAELRLQLIEGYALPTAGGVEKFRISLESLTSVSEGLTEVVPAPIAGFFRNADTPQGAPLSALTHEVQTFLHEHDIAHRYSIRGR